MKVTIKILISLLILIIAGCNNFLNEEEDIKKEEEETQKETYENQDKLVEQFVQSILDSTFTKGYIPFFNPEAIAPLLGYADDFSQVYYFPQNMLSSYYFNDKKLGECLLWTIEAIRVRHPFKDIFH